MGKLLSCATRKVPAGNRRRVPAAGALSLGLAVVLLVGCAENREKHNQEDLARLARWLPGTYDNAAQVKDEARRGVRSPHDPVELAIVPLDSVAVAVESGRTAFYMQEMAADDSRRVLSQKVIIFNATDKGIVETVSTLVEPLRWRDGQRDPDIFSGMTSRDYKVVTGCELTWKREGDAKDDGKNNVPKRFVGANDPRRCETTSHAEMGLVQVEMRAELSMNELATAELQYDSNGQLVLGNKEEPFYRFRKIGSR